MTARPALRLNNVVRTFPGVIALNNVSLDVTAGEVHALLGENGAGKSTLMAVAAGALAADSGSIEIGDQRLTRADPALAQELGLSVVYQHPSTLRDLTVAENLLYSIPRHRRSTNISAGAWVDRQLSNVGARFSCDVRVGELSPAERQLVEIAKALALQPRVLVLDEPTEALNAAEIETLFAQIARIRAQGTAVVYISHRLRDVQRVADRISILRDGTMRGTFPAEGVTEEQILSLIIGRKFEAAFPEKAGFDARAAPVLQMAGITGPRLQSIDFEVRPGEVVGLAGVEGNGQREFIRTIAGLARASGTIRLQGAALPSSDPVAAQQAGVIYLPGDRHEEGEFLDLSVRENSSILVLDQLSQMGVISTRSEADLSERYIRRLGVKCASPEVKMSTLSGGNQQKVMYARSIAAAPVVFLADEPTSGVDAGARVDLYNTLRQIAEEGAAVVILSSDTVELVGLCDRVVVFSRGRIVRELTGAEITEENITGSAIAGSGEAAGGAAGFSTWRRFLSGDIFPTVVLGGIILILALYSGTINERFLGARSISGLLFLASALAFISMGQLCVMLTGGIDLSVGPLSGLVVVILSFFVTHGMGALDTGTGIVVCLSAAAIVGLVNGVLIRIVKLSPLITTLAMFIALQGVSLLLRSVPGGFFRRDIVQFLTTKVGIVPAAFIFAVLVAATLEIILRKTVFGMELRAIGSSEEAARKLGARSDLSVTLAYICCSVLTGIGGILLGGQIAVGDPTAGQNYTLQSIAAVVLGGASVFGGRGSFLGVLAGVLLVQEIGSISSFLRLGSAWQYWLPGFLTLFAVAIYSRARGSARSAEA